MTINRSLAYLSYLLTIGLIEITHNSPLIPDLQIFVLLVPLVYIAQTNGRKLPWVTIIISGLYAYMEVGYGLALNVAIQFLAVSIFVLSIINHLRRLEHLNDSVDIIMVRLAVGLEAIRKLRKFEVYHYLPREFKETVDIVEDALGNLITKKTWLDVQERVDRARLEAHHLKGESGDD